MTQFKQRAVCVALAALSIQSVALAQTAQPPAVTPPADESPAVPKATEAPAIAKPDTPARADRVAPVEVTGRNSANDARRNASAAKIIITREDLEQYGDSNLGEAMRRLPGVTTGGRPGRPGAPQMRGMGGGFTQILLDGQRIPPGFSIEQITPEQVDRIEILRAPTAETGARAIAGTINIILREPIRQTNNELKAEVREERSKFSPNASWTRNGTLSETGTFNVTASVGATHQLTDTHVRNLNEDQQTGQRLLEQLGFSQTDDHRENYFLSGRAQWRLGAGEQFGVQSFFAHNTGDNRSNGTLTSVFQAPGTTPPSYATRNGHFEGRFDVARINLNLSRRIDEATRYELRGGIGKFWSNTESINEQFTADGARSLLQTTRGDVRDNSWNLNGKLIRNFGGSKHALTAGWEIESTRRDEQSLTRLNGVQQLADLGTSFDVGTRRMAAYVQDEWDISPEWAANAGLRYETIRTQSSTALDTYANTSRVLTPLAHFVWRFASPSRDQLRLSLTQSYRAPSVQQLTSRPILNTLYPLPAANTAVSPDRAGNPNLKPERANGVDLAFERYLKSGGVMSVNFFVRDIKDLIRTVSALEDVSWANADRYVARPKNIGKAITKGIEFDAKFQLRELIDDAIPLNLRFNLSVYDSNVAAVVGPYNRIDSQPRASGNLGADYKFRGAPLSVGGNLAWTPAYTTQQTDTQLQKITTKRVFDAFALWAINSSTKLRLSLSNIAPIDAITTNVSFADGQRQSVISDARTDRSVALRLELRL
ncbi:MAG: TonB-dependent receptor [Betaproteobacteria bacterium]|nr:MAG: TonB-dependent receptor [Betaproteobacteria bacterium]